MYFSILRAYLLPSFLSSSTYSINTFLHFPKLIFIMSHYGGSYRQGGDLYRPGNNRNPNHNQSSYGLGYGASRNNRNDSSSYRSTSQKYHQHHDHNNTQNRYQQKAFNNAYHQVYSQSQSEHQLWQGDLDPQWTEPIIMDIWAQVGENPVSVKLIRDKMGKPQYCFVTFSSQQAVASAIQKNRMQVPGSFRTFKLNWASGGSHGDPRAARQGGGTSAAKSSTEFSVFVGDLDQNVTEPGLYSRFSKEYPGAVKQVKIMVDPATGMSKGFGFVRFFTEDAQQSALRDMNGVIIGERPIRVGAATGGNTDASGASKRGKETSGEAPAVILAQKQPPLTPFTDKNNSVITIRGISASITREELISHFISFGNMIYCRVEYAKRTAQIKYYLRGSAEQALLFMHGFVINGCRLTLRWGREEVVSSGKLRFSPVDKSSKYVAAEKAPPVFGVLPYNIVFEDLSKEEVSSLNFIGKTEMVSAAQIDKQREMAIGERERFLEEAF